MFTYLKRNTSPTDAFALVLRGSCSRAHTIVTFSSYPITSPHRNTRRTGQQDVARGVLNVSQTHSRRYPLLVDYGLSHSDDRDYDIRCTVTNIIVRADLSLRTILFSEDARRQGCINYRGTVIIAALPNTVSAGPQPPIKIHFRSTTPNSECTSQMDLCLRQGKYTCVAGAKMAPHRGRQGNNRCNGSGNGRSHYTNNRVHNSTYQGNSQECQAPMLLSVPENSNSGQRLALRTISFQRPLPQ